MSALFLEATTVAQEEASQAMILESLTAYAQIVSAIGTAVLAFMVFRQVKVASEQATATRETVAEMKESRLTQDRPQVVVEADYSHHALIYLVVRNIGRGAAKDITFTFSESLPSSIEPPVNEQPYFEEGIHFLAPSAEIRGHGTQTGFLYGKTYGVSVAIRDGRLRPYPGSLIDPSGLRWR